MISECHNILSAYFSRSSSLNQLPDIKYSERISLTGRLRCYFWKSNPEHELHSQRTHNRNYGCANYEDCKIDFFSLPRELRDFVYQYAFTRRIELQRELQTPTACGAALLCTCKQVYDEALQLHYENTTFFTQRMALTLCWRRPMHSHTCKWIKDIHLYHNGRDPEASQISCSYFLKVRDSIAEVRTQPSHYAGEGVHKAFHYSPAGTQVQYSSGCFPDDWGAEGS